MMIAMDSMPPSTNPMKTSNGDVANLVVATTHIGKMAIAPEKARNCKNVATSLEDAIVVRGLGAPVDILISKS